jgi:hypothetical protein
VRRIFATGFLTLAIGLLSTASAGAHGWTLHLKPATVPQGGTVSIWTTARARTCALTIRIAGQNHRYRLDRHGDRFSLSARTALGRARVTVHCEGLVASESFRVVRPAAKQPAPTSPLPPTSPPASSPAPVAPTAPAAQATPLTVYNVCHFNPGLGTPQYIYPVVNGQVEPTAAWLDSSGQLAFLAASTDGDSAVDIAVIPTAADRSVIAYFARCNWSNWITVAQWQQAQPQAGVTAAQAGSQAYLQEVMPINDSLASLDLPWVTQSVGWSQCATNPYDQCDYELQPEG